MGRKEQLGKMVRIKTAEPKVAKPVYKWPDRIKPQLKTLAARRAYLERPSVKRWLARNASGLRVLDLRQFWCTQPIVIEFVEIYHQVVTRRGSKVIRVKIVCSDPLPQLRALLSGRG